MNNSAVKLLISPHNTLKILLKYLGFVRGSEDTSYIAARMKRIAIVIILAVICFPGKAQLDNRMFEWPRTYAELDSGRFYAGIRTLGYLRNNEYFNDVLEGYTLFGYQASPFVAWQAGRHVRLEGGIYLAQAFGEDDFQDVLPVFTISYRRKGHQFLFGTLQGNLSHRLVEPLYDFENLLGSDRLEYGVQYRYLNDAFFLDTWLDWRNAIEPGSDDQEELLGGLSAEYRWLDLGQAGFSTLLQATIFHRGGQIDASNLPLQTYLNTAFGLRGWVHPGDLRLTGDLYYVSFSDNSGTALLPFNGGKGFYANAFLEMPFHLGVMLSYWRSEEYFSPVGGRLYQNISYRADRPGEEQSDRELLFIRILYENELADGLILGVRGEPYADLVSREFEWSLGVYLNYQIQFALGKK